MTEVSDLLLYQQLIFFYHGLKVNIEFTGPRYKDYVKENVGFVFYKFIKILILENSLID